MTPKTQALIWRTALGFFLTALPIVTVELSKPNPDWRYLGLALLGALGAYLDKRFSPQLADTYLPEKHIDPSADLATGPVKP